MTACGNFLNILLYDLHSSNYVNDDLGEVVRRADADADRAESRTSDSRQPGSLS